MNCDEKLCNGHFDFAILISKTLKKHEHLIVCFHEMCCQNTSQMQCVQKLETDFTT